MVIETGHAVIPDEPRVRARMQLFDTGIENLSVIGGRVVSSDATRREVCSRWRSTLCFRAASTRARISTTSGGANSLNSPDNID